MTSTSSPLVTVVEPPDAIDTFASRRRAGQGCADISRIVRAGWRGKLGVPDPRRGILLERTSSLPGVDHACVHIWDASHGACTAVTREHSESSLILRVVYRLLISASILPEGTMSRRRRRRRSFREGRSPYRASLTPIWMTLETALRTSSRSIQSATYLCFSSQGWTRLRGYFAYRTRRVAREARRTRSAAWNPAGTHFVASGRRPRVRAHLGRVAWRVHCRHA
ncbi:hypothetical protein NFJ02_06g127670 [Pycnococcus provasolii]